MHGLQIMPFPFLNPWNWSAMTPTRAAVAFCVLARLNLNAWRALADAARTTWRAEQDALLGAAEAQWLKSERSTKAKPAAPPPAPR